MLGGGHSPISSKYGLSADQVLALQVVLANGSFVTATEETDRDLFWALRGAGGSTFGVVTSIISAVYPPDGVTVSTFSFSTGPNTSADAFWAGFRAYLDYFPAHADAGIYTYFWLVPDGNNEYTFIMHPIFAAGQTPAQVNALVQPWFTQLDHLGVQVQNLSTAYHTNIYDAWRNSFPPLPVGKFNTTNGSRLFPRTNWANETILNETFSVLRETVSSGYRVIAYNVKFPQPAFSAPNAVNSAFRSALMLAITAFSWDPSTPPGDILAQIRNFTGPVLDPWRRVSPGSGTYLSEAAVLEPDFQTSFYGQEQYGRLLALKQRFDPEGVFYALRTVGSEAWELQSRTVAGFPDQNGRLCRVKS